MFMPGAASTDESVEWIHQLVGGYGDTEDMLFLFPNNVPSGLPKRSIKAVLLFSSDHWIWSAEERHREGQQNGWAPTKINSPRSAVEWAGECFSLQGIDLITIMFSYKMESTTSKSNQKTPTHIHTLYQIKQQQKIDVENPNPKQWK